jgi:hypothetical protein
LIGSVFGHLPGVLTREEAPQRVSIACLPYQIVAGDNQHLNRLSE